MPQVGLSNLNSKIPNMQPNTPVLPPLNPPITAQSSDSTDKPKKEFLMMHLDMSIGNLDIVSCKKVLVDIMKYHPDTLDPKKWESALVMFQNHEVLVLSLDVVKAVPWTVASDKFTW